MVKHTQPLEGCVVGWSKKKARIRHSTSVTIIMMIMILMRVSCFVQIPAARRGLIVIVLMFVICSQNKSRNSVTFFSPFFPDETETRPIDIDIFNVVILFAIHDLVRVCRLPPLGFVI